ncbi:MAG: hypothetical protein ABIO44_06660 [Saprospiraceae bacterium]
MMILGAISCKNNSKVASIKDKTEVENTVIDVEFENLPSDFKEFYYTFHKDSIFQMSSIFFPLEGLPNEADPKFIGDEKFFWSPDQWILQKEIIHEGELYDTEYRNINNRLIEETITERKNDLKLIRRFAKTGSGWRLIYYAGMNKYSKKSN